MAKHITVRGDEIDLSVPLTLTAMQTCVGGFIRFVEVGPHIFIVNEAGLDFAQPNDVASELAGQPMYGDVIVCYPQEIA